MSSPSNELNATLLVWCGLALVGWAVAARIQGWTAQPARRRALYGPRMGFAFAFWFFALQMLTAWTETTGRWPLCLIALSAAVASEIALFCYQSEKTPTSSGTSSAVQTLLPLLRVAIIGVLSALLLEPILTHEEEQQEDRSVAVLVDASASMSLPSRLTLDREQTRGMAAMNLLFGDSNGASGLLARLQQDYDVRLYEFGASAREVDGDQLQYGMAAATARDAGDSTWSATTDMADALRQVRGDIPTDKLSGIVLLSDGCDHSRTDLQQRCQALGSRDIAVNTVVIGSLEPPKDAQVVSVQVPSQIYYGDSLSLNASIKVDQYEGETARIRLLDGDELIEERSVLITSNHHRETLAFRHQPEEARIHEYRVELDELAHEEATHNNVVTRPVWVSKDHIRALLIEERPRWEFRYLRNLFAGRDRTVFLQAVLLDPDRLAGVPAPPVMHASVQRAFDDCDANALPLDEDEWLKFDVIILGDVSPTELGKDGIRTLERFVKDRGGALVVIAGPNSMPHAYRSTPLTGMLPVLMNGPPLVTARSPEENFYFSLTQEGVTHPVLQRSPTASAAPSLSFPELTWRHPNCEAKVGASVLAYASRERVSPDQAATRLADQRRQALMLWHRFGAGKVLQINFDETWRLRYGIGDRLHHEFWGQVLRWSVSERLSAGTDLVRLGTDRSLYKSDDRISIQARLLDANRSPVTDAAVQAVVLLNDEVVRTIELTPHPESMGMLHGEVCDLTQSGRYRVELSGDVIDQLLALEAQGIEKVGLDFAVEPTAANIERLDLVADETVPRQIADWTGGTVVDLSNADSVLANLGPKSTFLRQRWTVPLWNIWPVIGLFLSGLSVEWILRKVTGRI